MPRYDQHFLRSERIAFQIAKAVCPLPGETILEVGPGEGALTKYLLQSSRPYLGVEIDPRCLSALSQTYPNSHAQWILGDFLKIPLPEIPLYFVSNLPYSISGPAIFRILEHQQWIRAGIIMLQAEVAQRLYASAGKRPYGKLSVLFQSVYHVKRLVRVPPGAFSPPPRVWSEVITFTQAPYLAPKDWMAFADLVRSAFRQPRQTIAKNLQGSTYIVPEKFRSLRPHQLSVQDFFELWDMQP